MQTKGTQKRNTKSDKGDTATAESEELKQLKSDILAHREVFASFDFYMPDFDAAIESVQDIQIANFIRFFYDSTIPGIGTEIIPFSNGNNKTHEIAQHFAQIRTQQILTRLEISPEPLITLKNEGELYKQYIQDQKAKDKDFSMGYDNIFQGYSEPIKSVYKRALHTHFRETDLNPLSNYGYREPDTLILIPFINAAVLTDKRAAWAMNRVKGIVHGAVYAYFETLLSRIEEELNAGKSVAEIRTELFPEMETENKDVAPGPKVQRTENVFCKLMPIDAAREHFRKLVNNHSMNGEPFLTDTALENFIKRAFLGDTTIPKQVINLNRAKEAGIIRNVFHQFYDMASNEWEPTTQCLSKYISLLTDNFQNWKFATTHNNFTKKPTRPI